MDFIEIPVSKLPKNLQNGAVKAYMAVEKIEGFNDYIVETIGETEIQQLFNKSGIHAISLHSENVNGIVRQNTVFVSSNVNQKAEKFEQFNQFLAMFYNNKYYFKPSKIDYRPIMLKFINETILEINPLSFQIFSVDDKILLVMEQEHRHIIHRIFIDNYKPDCERFYFTKVELPTNNISIAFLQAIINLKYHV